ncbi:MAG: hypothetical protein IKB88_10820 [Clostridia bacterium]|nr:hypothetical protein [Clostridia bacterium]
MKINSKCPVRAEQIAVAALLFMKTVLTLPFYEKLFGVGEHAAFSFGVSELLSAIGALILSVLFSVMVTKASEKLGSKILVILLVADPFFVTTISSAFHVLASVITVAWMTVCFSVSKKSVIAVVSVVSAALVSFLMPCAIFSYVFLGIAVTLIMLWDEKVTAFISAAASAAVSVAIVSLIDDHARISMKIAGMFSVYGGNECHTVSFAKLTDGMVLYKMFSKLSEAVVASLPVVAIVIFVIVSVIKHKSDYSEKKTSGKEKGAIIALLVIPYVLSVFASAMCVGKGGIAGFNLIPLAVLLALEVKGDKSVVIAINSLGEFVKKYPAVAVVSLVWFVSFTMEFVSVSKIFSSATQFNL